MDQSPTEQDKKPQIASNQGTTTLITTTVDQLDIEILPIIYDIIRCVEKDPINNSAKQTECSTKILELQKRFEHARSQVKLLPGIDFNKEEQLQQLESLKNQLKLKQQLIAKLLFRYLANNEQLVQKLSESYIMRRAAQISVSIFYRTKIKAEEYNIKELTPEKFKSFIETFKKNIREEIEATKSERKK